MIEKFKKEHNIIIETLMEVEKTGLKGEKSLANLAKAKNLLLEHLTKEDQQLYPFLLGSPDEGIAAVANEFKEEIEAVSPMVLSFFDKYLSNNPEKDVTMDTEGKEEEFKKDFDSLTQLLLARIEKEEEILYPSYRDYLLQSH